MLEWVQILCGVLYAVVLAGMSAGVLWREKTGGREKKVCIREASRAEKAVFQARKHLSSCERLVVCLPSEQFFNRELCYIIQHMQRRDPALKILWMEEKEARAG